MISATINITMAMPEQSNTSSSAPITHAITVLLRLALAVVALLAAFTQNWEVLFAGVGALALTYVPQVLANQINVRLPLQFELAITVFLYASIFLGEVGDFYQRFWWWDTVLHAGSSFAFGFTGFLILFLLYARGKLRASPIVVAVFAFTFGMAIGVLWEIFEFAMDSLFGLNMQKSGLRDTMWDLIIDAIGAGVASTIGYVYLKHKIWDPFDVMIKWFLNANPRFKPRGRSVRRRP